MDIYKSLICLFLLFSISLSHAVLGQPATSTLPPSLPSVPENTESPEGNTPEYVVIRSSNEATFSSETTASVALLPVKEGSIFHKGDILLQLDCRSQQADLEKAQAQEDVAAKAWDSAKKLKGYGSISEFELIKAESEAKAAAAELDKLKVVVEKCVIIAPFNGAVADVLVHPLETVKPGDPLLKIVNTENLNLEIQIPSTWLTWLRVGSKFSVHVNDINKTVTATVIRINPQIEPVSQTVKIIGTITPPDPALRPGMSGQASFLDNPKGTGKH